MAALNGARLRLIATPLIFALPWSACSITLGSERKYRSVAAATGSNAGAHRIVYRVALREIRIVRVLHGRMDFRRHLR